MSWQVKLDGVDQVTPEIREAVHLGIRDGAEALGVEGAKMVQENITTPYQGLPPAVFRGNLAGSVTSQLMEEQAFLRLVIGVSPTLGADSYAAPVETGTKPHMPPPSALIPWVMQKFGADDEKQALSLAFAVSRSIAKKGTQGHEMFSRALASLEPMAVPTIEHAIGIRTVAAGFGGEA